MSTRKELTAAVPRVDVAVTQSDWDEADPGLIRSMLSQTRWIRVFEEYVLQLASAHSSIGQEGGAVGSIVGLRGDDYVNGSHRGHHQLLAKAFGHVLPPPGRRRRRGAGGDHAAPDVVGRPPRPGRGDGGPPAAGTGADRRATAPPAGLGGGTP